MPQGADHVEESSNVTDDRRRTVFDTPINPDFGEGRWQDALRRMRARIAAGLEFVAWDSDAIGAKDTHCSWGMCSNDLEQWPDKDDHTFPDDFEERERVSPRSARGGCPLDKRTGTSREDGMWGCFYNCRVFNYGEIDGEKRPEDRKRTLELYDRAIAERESAHGRKTTADDREPWREVGNGVQASAEEHRGAGEK